MHFRSIPTEKHLATLLSMSAFPPQTYNGNHRKETEETRREGHLKKAKHLCTLETLQATHKGEYIFGYMSTFHNLEHFTVPGKFELL